MIHLFQRLQTKIIVALGVIFFAACTGCIEPDDKPENASVPDQWLVFPPTVNVDSLLKEMTENPAFLDSLYKEQQKQFRSSLYPSTSAK